MAAFGFFEPQKGQSAEGIAKSRAMAAALLRSGSAPKNVGEGLSAIGDAIFYRSLIGNADASEKAGTDAFNSQFNSLIAPYTGGQASTVPMPTAAGEVAATSPAVDISGSRKSFIESLLPAAIEQGQRTGVDPRIIVAQAAQETGWGKSAPGNNYFGIKSHGQSGGNTLATTEYVNGSPVTEMASFRGYASPADSVRGYGDFITQNPRYKPLREAQGLDAQLAALGASGYATDPNYANSVGSIARSITLPNQQMASASPVTATDAIESVSPQVAAPQLPAPTTVAAAPAVAEVAPIAAPQQVAQNFQPQQIDPRLIEAANSPFATPGQKAILGGIIQQQQARNELILKQQMQQADPAYQIGLEKSQIELNKLKNPGEPADIQELRIRAKEAGIEPGTPEYQALFASGGKSPLVTVNNGDNSGAFAKKSDEEAATRLGAIVSEGNAAPQLIGDLQQLAELGKQIGTGKGAQVTAAIGPYAQALGIDVKGLDESQAFTAIVNRLAPQMRPVGAGATSDFDARQFLSSLPSLGNQPGGNELISQTFQSVQQNKLAAAEIASKAQTGEIKWQEAERQIRALPNPYEVFKKNREKLGQASNSENPLPPTPSPQGQRPRATNPQTGAVIEFDGKGWVPVQ